MTGKRKLSSPASSPGFDVSLPVQNGFVVVQSNGKEMYLKMCAASAIFACLLIRSIDFVAVLP